MKPNSPSRNLCWLTLGMAMAMMVVLVGWIWLTSYTAAPRGYTAPAEVATVAPVQARPTANSFPLPAPSIVTSPGDTSAPEFQGIDQWFNSGPFTMEEQRGKVVLIDFWTYS